MKNTGIYYEDYHVKYFLAKINNDFVGITGLYYYDSNDAWLAWFGILEEYRNKGLGKILLRTTCELAASMNFKNMRIYTDYVELHDACLLYEKNGNDEKSKRLLLDS